MMQAEVISVLREIYALEATSFVSFIIEMSRPPVLDEEDRKALSLFQDLHREIDENRRAIGTLLEDAGVKLGTTRWPLRYTTFNFLKPRYLLQPMLERLRAQLSQVEDRTNAIDVSEIPEVQSVFEEILVRERASIERLKQSVGDIPGESPSEGVSKGTSASRW